MVLNIYGCFPIPFQKHVGDILKEDVSFNLTINGCLALEIKINILHCVAMQKIHHMSLTLMLYYWLLSIIWQQMLLFSLIATNILSIFCGYWNLFGSFSASNDISLFCFQIYWVLGSISCKFLHLGTFSWDILNLWPFSFCKKLKWGTKHFDHYMLCLDKIVTFISAPGYNFQQQ